jgi:hypothetical protein
MPFGFLTRSSVPGQFFGLHTSQAVKLLEHTSILYPLPPNFLAHRRTLRVN